MTETANFDPQRVSAEISLWPKNDGIILNKFRLFSWNLPQVFPSDQVAANLMAMDQTAFWNRCDRPEFLILLRDRWLEFTDHEKARLLERLLTDRENSPDEEISNFAERRDCETVARIRWLELQGCELPTDALGLVAEIQDRLPNWNDECARDAAISFERYSSIEMRNSHEFRLYDVPIPMLVNLALEHASSQSEGLPDYGPFEKLG